MIRRLTQGVYDYPKVHDILGRVPPDLNEVAKAIAEKNGVQIQPAGALAANLVGLSEQVPGQIIFLTEGPSRKIKIGNQEIIFKKTTKKVMSAAGTREGLLIQALKNLGKDHIVNRVRTQIAKFLKNLSKRTEDKGVKPKVQPGLPATRQRKNASHEADWLIRWRLVGQARSP